MHKTLDRLINIKTGICRCLDVETSVNTSIRFKAVSLKAYGRSGLVDLPLMIILETSRFS